MTQVFGTQWQALFHGSHKLVCHRPYVFCASCGHHTKCRQHLSKLSTRCEPPLKGSPMLSRRKFLLKGLEPLTPHTPLQGQAVLLPQADLKYL